MSSDLGRWFNLGNPGLQRPGPTQTDRVTVRRSVLLYGGNRLFRSLRYSGLKPYIECECSYLINSFFHIWHRGSGRLKPFDPVWLFFSAVLVSFGFSLWRDGNNRRGGRRSDRWLAWCVFGPVLCCGRGGSDIALISTDFTPESGLPAAILRHWLNIKLGSGCN